MRGVDGEYFLKSRDPTYGGDGGGEVYGVACMLQIRLSQVQALSRPSPVTLVYIRTILTIDTTP